VPQALGRSLIDMDRLAGLVKVGGGKGGDAGMRRLASAPDLSIPLGATSAGRAAVSSVAARVGSPACALPSPMLQRKDKVDKVIVETYQYLAIKSDKRAELTNERLTMLCQRLSELGPREATTVRDLMRHHRSLYPRAGDQSFMRNRYYPYEDMEDQGSDLKVYVDKLPTKLLAILDTYVELLTEED
jgi:hypothetical protein